MQLNVLVVDDEKDVVFIIKNLLEESGYSVSKAFNGETAWMKVQNKRPDIIISDIVMPKLDGWQLLDKIKSNDSTRDIPVILLTQKDDFDNVYKAFQKGTTFFLPKPFDREALLNALNELDR